MPPAATVDFRGPSNLKFDLNNNIESGNGSENGSGNPSGSCKFNAGSCSSSSSSCAAMGRASSNPATRKVRLAKHRKSSKYSSIDPGINPFRSVNSKNDDAPNSSNKIIGQFENSGFVFGVSNSKKDDNNNTKYNNAASNDVGLEPGMMGNVGVGVKHSKIIDLETDFSLRKEEFSENLGASCSNETQNKAEGGKFSLFSTADDLFGSSHTKTGQEFELSEKMKKLNIENIENNSRPVETVQVHNDVDTLKGGDQFFVFTSGGKNSNASAGSSVPLENEVNATNSDENREGFNAGKTGRVSSRLVDDDVFVFGCSGEPTRPSASSSQPSVFQDEINGVRNKENVVPLSFSSSSLGVEVGSGKPRACSVSDEKKVDICSSSMPVGSGDSLSEFKLPQFDASLSFSATLPSWLRTRVSRDKVMKKTKGKSRQSKPTKEHPVQKPVSSKSVTQDLEVSESYSPMDFSPYEDTTPNTDVPPSSHPDTNLTGIVIGDSSAVFTEPQPNMAFMSTGLGVTSTGPCIGISSSTSGNDSVGPTQIPFGSNVSSRGEEKFTFGVSNSTRDDLLSLKHRQRRKFKLRNGSLSGCTSMAQGRSLNSNPLLSRTQGHMPESEGKDKTIADNEEGVESSWSVTEKSCEKWRRRGNEAYEKGELSKAENFYTWGVNSIPPGDAPEIAFTPLVRCYSNRAATRMALGRVREAIQDCLTAVKLDPTFHRAHIRAANCYLLLGELEDAMHCFGKCMELANVVCLDRQVVISASDGIQKSQKVIECTNQSAELLKLRTPEGATSALESIAKAMSISLYSEKLLEMKAEALCMLQKHEEVITLCQKTLDFAEKNFITTTPGSSDVNGSCFSVRLWRHRISSKCHFHLGRLEVALDLLEKQESGNKMEESSDPLAVTISELLKKKSAGNTAFQSGKHGEAIEHYTCAILSSIESRPFAAICFCNRAASHQALGQIADAIADCSLAIALDENYAKAVSRRATLHEMIRDYKQASVDLQRLVSLLEKQSHEKPKQSGSVNGKELRQVQQRLSKMEEEAKREVPLDLYLILGIKKSDPAAEIKKAYRKAALRHHPDKAAQALVRGDTGDEGRLWKDIAELVHKDSDRLFKMIGEAYAVLSDPTKREEYDHAEDLRKLRKESSNVRSASRRQSYYNDQDCPFERSSNRRYWQENFRTSNNSYRRW